MTRNDLEDLRLTADLNQRLSRSVAINAVKQAINLIDVRIEASMREMEQFKKLLEKLESYES